MITDSVSADPKHYKVEFENERVRVVRAHYGPREKSVMHSHPELVCTFLTDANFRFTYPDGKSEEINAKAGDILPHEAFEHLPENVSDRPFEAILVELKK
jgi:quercetin dioxygenase-like cupin family protein